MWPTWASLPRPLFRGRPDLAHAISEGAHSSARTNRPRDGLGDEGKSTHVIDWFVRCQTQKNVEKQRPVPAAAGGLRVQVRFGAPSGPLAPGLPSTGKGNRGGGRGWGSSAGIIICPLDGAAIRPTGLITPGFIPPGSAIALPSTPPP